MILGGVGTMTSLMFIDLNSEELKTIHYLLPISSIILFSLVLFIIRSQFKSVPTITLDKYSIKFGNGETYFLKDISDIKLQGKIPFGIFRTQIEGTELHFENGQSKSFFDDMYNNSCQLKSFLEQVVVAVDKKDSLEIDNNDTRSNSIKIVNKYKGKQFISFNGISLWGLTTLFVIIIVSFSPPTGFYIFISILWLFLFLINSYQMHYFGMNREFLIVKNHNLFWKKKVYRFSNIKEIIFETQGRGNNSLRIVTKDYRTGIYPAVTLQIKTWLALKEQIESKGIIVRNECIC